MKRIIFLTGRPGVGKTTVLSKVMEKLQFEGYSVGGIVSREIRERYSRVGFESLDILTRRRGILAHIKQPTGPRLGKYRVNIEDLDSIGANAIRNASREADIIIIDEIGPMELFSDAFRDSVIDAINSQKTVLGTIHYMVNDPLITLIKNRKDVEIVEVTPENRETLHEYIQRLISGKLREKW